MSGANFTPAFGRRTAEPVLPDRKSAEDKERAHATMLKELRAECMVRLDPAAIGGMSANELAAEVEALISEIATERRVQLNAREQHELAGELVNDMLGLGPLEKLLADETISDIMVNGPERIFAERRGKVVLTGIRFRDRQHVTNVSQRIASAVGRRIDESSPMVDARLSDGSRVNIVFPPLALDGPYISIRKFGRHKIDFTKLVEFGSMTRPVARVLEIVGRARLNIVISGGTGSGKTTLLNAMSRLIDDGERVITVEDAAELQLQQAHVVRLETRPASLEERGEVTQRDLVRNALRMRPDRIIIGEVRGPEAFDMLQAMNTGHDGSMSTIHANNTRDAISRIENMVMMANLNLPLKAIRMHVASALNLIVHIERMRDGIRRVQNIVEIAGMEGDMITARELFTFRHRGEWNDGTTDGAFESTRMRPDFIARAARFGLSRELLDAVGIGGT